MREHELVSVIIPVYNVARYLRESLGSCICQTYKDLEIIIIDDGSTDGSREICDEYAAKDERICLVHQSNKGLSAARNVGLDMMTGAAVAFLDSDDSYHPDYIRLMVETMNLGETDIVVCGYSVRKTEKKMECNKGDKKTGPTIHKGRYNRVEALRALVEGRLNHGVWNKLYKKELWNDIRFPEGFVYEEVRTTYRILNLVNSITVIDQPLYQYRDRLGSITNTITQKNARDRLLARDEFGFFIEANIQKIFTLRQLETWKYDQFNFLISTYVQFCLESDYDCVFCTEVRRKIRENWRKIRIRGTRTLLLTLAICYCSWLFNIVYPVYKKIKTIMRKMICKDTRIKAR